MKNESLKEVVKKMCCAMPGGREALAGALGMSLTTFNNNLYEKNGCRFFDNDELEAMEDLTKTRHLVEYHMDRHGITPMEAIEPENIDEVELFKIQTNLSSHQGQLASLIQKSLEDDVLTPEEMTAIYKKMNKVFAYALGFVASLKAVYGVGNDSGNQKG
ncbi:YmfL family putative regulatory protein [Morganella morganii]|uniref:Phage protein n=2 Tax=Morganella morganii TaxID=582 RepID=A0AAU8ZMR3_MORMO|nr:YmfL family putative regulatory protein [Morganella morganii]SGD90405.1 Uncharacterised protein [Mycobacterium tuberculosis]HDU8694389.1 hypothetical protein [Morganella morganii subsp. morganii]AWC94550.1 hypothetical protein AM380_13390 [Morganella morganii]ELI9036130.1 hypothetical protein [Morganella morganii]ELN8404608.1 hypothetical protein [Morganella morganii]